MPEQTKQERRDADAALQEELRALLAQGDLAPELQEAIIALSNSNNTTLVDLPDTRNLRGQYARMLEDKPTYGTMMNADGRGRGRFPDVNGEYPPPYSAMPGDMIAGRDSGTPDHEGIHRLQDSDRFRTETGVPRIDEIIAQQMSGQDGFTQRWVRTLDGDNPDHIALENAAYALANNTHGPQGELRAGSHPPIRETLSENALMLLGLNNDARELQKLYPDQIVPDLPRYGRTD